jgi:hypothetical protein
VSSALAGDMAKAITIATVASNLFTIFLSSGYQYEKPDRSRRKGITERGSGSAHDLSNSMEGLM